MPDLHYLNIVVHVVAGATGLLVGTTLLYLPKGTPRHRWWGRIFVGLAAVVCLSAWAGTVFFRFVPVFATLSVLVTYLVLGGWRVVYTKARGPGIWDALLTAAAVAGTAGLVPILLQAKHGQGSSAPVVLSTLAALAVIIVYDIAKWRFPRHWHAHLWRYEHIYKIVSALSGMASAAVGNLFHTTSAQLLPSVIGSGVIAWFFWREYRHR